MKDSIDFKSLYETEFLNNINNYKRVLGIKFDPFIFIVLFVFITIVSLLIGGFSMFLPSYINAPIHDFIDYYLLGYDSVLWYLFIITFPFIVVISYFVGNYNSKKYALKSKTLAPIIEGINKSFKYKHTNYIQKAVFKDSKIFSQSIWSYSGNDLAMGKIEDNYIMFSDLLVKSFAQTFFHGQFIVTEFNKNFEGTTLLLTDNAEVIFGKVVGGFIQSSFSGDDLVRMDDPEFEELFVVHSNDKVEAHYILTPTLMQRILSYKKKTKHYLQISFFNNVVAIAISYDKDHFEYIDSSVFKSEAQLKEAFDKEFTEPLALVTDLIKELKLNEKLWSKR